MPEILTDQDEVLFQEEPRLYRLRGKVYPSVTERIKGAGFGTDFSRVNRALLEHARQRGNAVDDALTYHYEGDLDSTSVDPAIKGYLAGAFKFDEECPGQIVAIHPRLCDTKMGLAGTPDIIRFVRGYRSVVDWKTGADNPLQTWMYMMLWNRAHVTQPVYKRYGLRLKANGDYVLRQHADLDDGAAAMAIISGDEKAIEVWRPKYGY